MKIGVISDSHDRLPALRQALAVFEQAGVEAILHAGDMVAPFAAKVLAEGANPGRPVHCIYGNNDGERKGLKKVLPQIQDGPLRLALAGRTIVMHHAEEDLGPGDLAGADVVVTGHTHQVLNEVRDGVLHLNPGECCGWTTERCTIAVLDTDAVSAEIVEICP
jgi:putative phosphoesterase